MLFGVLPPYRTGAVSDPEWLVAFVRHAEAVGFESVYTAEHLVVPADYTTPYPYAPSRRMLLPVDAAIPDPLELLAFCAAHTDRLRLGTGIVVLPLHNPVQLAKRAATVDVLSGGRLILGVGVGWLREEADAVGVPFDQRGARTDEAIAALRVLWAEDEPSFSGRFWQFERACSYPKPLARKVPIHIGGHSRAAARRAGRLGDGFHPLGLDDDGLRDRLAALRRAADAAGRDADVIELTLGGGLVDTDDEAIERARSFGAARMVLGTRERDIAKVRDQLSAFADRFIAAGAPA